MRVYLDVCCLNRPFDDQSQERIRLESDAIESIFRLIQKGKCLWIVSDSVLREINANPDEESRNKVRALLRWADESIALSEATSRRAGDLIALGFGAMDALHVAFSESSGCIACLTTDDGLLKLGKRWIHELAVRVENPVTWLAEVVAR